LINRGSKRYPTLPIIIPEKRTDCRNYFCRKVIEREDLYSHPDYTEVHHETAERNHHKHRELRKIIPFPIMEREIFIQDVTD
jgi:hypothetical protein